MISYLPITLSLVVALLTAQNGTSMPMRVVVSGAGGQTGNSVFRKMLSRPGEFTPFGLVRTTESRDALVEKTGCSAESVFVCDVSDEKSLTALPKFDALVIGTSAKPSPTGVMNEATGGPLFGFPNGKPELVDWIGQKNQIDAAVGQGPDTRVVICSSMGGTEPEHMLNQLGKEIMPDGTTEGGYILRWKRKAEMYLIASGLPYTIVHPGGLLNEAGGVRELVVGVDDIMEGTGSDNRTVPREDVAEVLLQSLLSKEYLNRSFDLRAKPEGEGVVTADFDALISRLDGASCDYSLGIAGV